MFDCIISGMKIFSGMSTNRKEECCFRVLFKHLFLQNNNCLSSLVFFSLNCVSQILWNRIFFWSSLIPVEFSSFLFCLSIKPFVEVVGIKTIRGGSRYRIFLRFHFNVWNDSTIGLVSVFCKCSLKPIFTKLGHTEILTASLYVGTINRG